MQELQMIIKQERGVFRLSIECENTLPNKHAIMRVFSRYDEVNGIISTHFSSPSIVKLTSMQMAFICELSENGQI